VADGSNQNESPDEWDRRLENLIRQQRGEPPLPPPSAGTSSGAPGAASGERGRNADTADIAQRGNGKPSVAEFLEMMQGVLNPQPIGQAARPSVLPSRVVLAGPVCQAQHHGWVTDDPIESLVTEGVTDEGVTQVNLKFPLLNNQAQDRQSPGLIVDLLTALPEGSLCRPDCLEESTANAGSRIIH
jgi:hypothetical protein